MVKMMDQIALKKAAENLEYKLRDNDLVTVQLKFLYDSLKPLLNSAKNMKIVHPIDESNIPGSYQYNEGVMRDLPDVEEAYAEFRIQLSGGGYAQNAEYLEFNG